MTSIFDFRFSWVFVAREKREIQINCGWPMRIAAGEIRQPTAEIRYTRIRLTPTTLILDQERITRQVGAEWRISNIWSVKYIIVSFTFVSFVLSSLPQRQHTIIIPFKLLSDLSLGLNNDEFDGCMVAMAPICFGSVNIFVRSCSFTSFQRGDIDRRLLRLPDSSHNSNRGIHLESPQILW